MSWISALAGVAGSVASGIQGASAAHNAAAAETQYAKQAQQLEQQNQQQAENFQQGILNNTIQAESPYQSLGQTSANNLQGLISNGFQAPSMQDVATTPQYQFNLQQGTNAINENAAATGNLMSGNTGVALQQYGQGLASQSYQQAYNNALQQYQTNYNSAMGGTNAGLTSTGQLGQFGQLAANNMGNLALTGAQQQAQQLNNQGNAQAQGDLGAAQAWNGMIGGLESAAGNFSNYGSMMNMNNMSSYGQG